MREEQGLLKQRLDFAAVSAGNVKVVIVLGNTLALLFLIAATVVTYHEIRRRASVEREVEIRNAQLENANKELESFSYSVSHDLRAPLRGIDGFSGLLLEDYSSRLDEKGREYLTRIRVAAQRMATLIDDLLNLSRISRVEVAREPVDLSELATSISTDYVVLTRTERSISRSRNGCRRPAIRGSCELFLKT